MVAIEHSIGKVAKILFRPVNLARTEWNRVLLDPLIRVLPACQ
jgi:hypothetical protein